MNRIIFGDNLEVLRSIATESIDLIYIDPPFNTGKNQKMAKIKTVRSKNGDRAGFQGNKYQSILVGTKEYSDSYGDGYIDSFLFPRLQEAYRVLAPHGSLYFHIDYRESHYCKIVLDKIFGRECFLNEIVWAYDYGAKSKSKWPTKHDNIFLYVKNPSNYVFNAFAIDREPYMAPGLVGPEKAERGKLPTDTWWHTIVGTNSRERTGYPTQKPVGIINRMVQASSNPGDSVLDFFAGSGTVGESCLKLGRNFILIDNNFEALETMAKRFSGISNVKWENFDPLPFQGKKKTVVQPQDTPDFHLLASAATYIQSDLVSDVEGWENSPLFWVLGLAPAAKGKLGRHLIATWCVSNGLSVDRIGNKDANLVVNGHRVATKFSTLWSGGIYKFQQIRSVGYDYLICLGISPNDAHCWIVDRKTILTYATVQHKGAKGSEYWLTINPDKPEDWLRDYGGSLIDATVVLKRTLR
ncbi:MAG: site-specific DNA-methyltransferase [Anaerolineales bacterium]|nr:site-specific DNA-methyltransferase [Anaerolineales bacterium]